MTWRFATLADALAQQAKDRAEAVAVRFVEPAAGGALADSSILCLTFAELDRRAACVAAALAREATAGDRALLLCPPGLDYVAALFGCFYAGVVAVPAYPPASARPDERLRRLIGDSAPAAVLTVGAMAGFCEELCAHAGEPGKPPRVVAADTLAPIGPCGTATAGAPDALALLQYTSGSTGDPAGVMLTNANLTANVASIATRLAIAGEARGVFWLPPYHDMGLVGGILTSVVLGGETTLMSPLSFLARPLLWLEAVDRFRGTFSAAPNFAYDLCVRKVPSEKAAALDLRSWKSVVNGAEPIRQETLDRFAAHFAPGGFRRSAFMPAYGLAEATLLVSAARLGTRRRAEGSAATPPAGLPATSGAGARVSVGTPDEDAQLLIVDPEARRVLPEGQVGEIWFRGPSVGAGYWGDPEKSEATFAATLAQDRAGARFLRTGDLGELRGGELYVGGRIKDLIIVRGQNHHPHDIELAASSADSRLRPGCLAAFEIDRGGHQKVVLVAELAAELGDEHASRELFARVRARVGEEVGISLDELVLIERGTSLKTSSGKIRRAATRAAYLEDTLRVVARGRRAAGATDHPDAPSRAGHGVLGAAERATRRQRLAQLPAREREEALRRLVLEQLGSLAGAGEVEGMAGACTFKQLGLESPGAVELSALLSEQTGLDLPPTVCFEHPSPAALVSHLCSRLAGLQHPRVARTRSPATSEPVAIVGMGCRFPGGVDSPERLWELVSAGADAISGFPRDRGWDLEQLFADDPDRPGSSHVREGGFLQDACNFDARFFGIPSQQAAAMDPQQRLMLEVAWEALEDAGIDPTSLQGSATAVFVGLSSVDHAVRLGAQCGHEVEGHLVTGAAASAVSGRVAYALGLRGPALSIDTACSSSLVALHEACRALSQGECSLALAGGVTVLCTPAVFTGFSRQGALAADGRCKPFAAAADGTGFSEGAGLLVLERLRDAQRHGHRLLALVRGSAVNHDGRSNGFTAPNPSAQEEVIRAALAAASLAGDDVDAVEAHGTGTLLGDPIEARALIATYGRRRARPLWLGSVKSNLGHTQAAAGVAGVMKMVMAMHHRLLPGTLHADRPSPHIDWDAGAVRLLSRPRRWPRHGRPRRAGVSSFGVSGTNAHVLLEAPAQRAPGARAAPPTTLPWLLSARSEPALRRQAERLRSHLRRHEELSALDAAYTLACGRPRMEHRAAIVTGEREALAAGLGALAAGEPAENLVCARAQSGVKAAFVFGGQGGQWHGMARELMRSSAIFARHLRACARALSAHVDWSLEDVLAGVAGAPPLDRADVIQPVLWAVMVSLAELWRAFGVQPALVAGHSQGEIAAAHVAGGLSLDDAARLVAVRGQALREIEGAGGMVSLGVGAEEALRLIAPFGEHLSLAARNGPHTVVVSGDSAALDALTKACEAEGRSARRIAVGFASHSPQVEAIRERLLSALVPLRPRTSRVPFVSCLTGEVTDTASLDGPYWYRALRQPVRFAAATRTLMREGCSVLIEVSPHPVLTVPMQETIDAQGAGERVAVIGSLRRGRADSDSFTRALAEAFVRGVEVDWAPLFAARGAGLTGLPTYPFERERHWLMPRHAGAESSPGPGRAEHALLGASTRLADRDAWLLSGRVSLSTHPLLADQRILDTAVMPASALLEMALHAGSRVGCEEVRELALEAPLVLSCDGVVELQASVGEPDGDGCRALTLASRAACDDGDGRREWTRHALGVLAPAGPAPARDGGRKPWPPPGAEPIELDYLHERLAELGVSFGRALESVRHAWISGGEVLAEVAPADARRDAGLRLPPGLPELLLQVASLYTGAPIGEGIIVPRVWSGVTSRDAGLPVARAQLELDRDGAALAFSGADGSPVLCVDKLLAQPMDSAPVGCAPSESELLLELCWPNLRAVATARPGRDLGVLGDPQDVAIAAPRYADLGAVADALAEGACVRTLLASLATEDDSPAGIRHAVEHALALLKRFLAEERLAGVRLALLTHGGVAAREHEVPGLAGAALWGFLSSAQAEHPSRLVLADVDGASGSWDAVPRALGSGEPQFALRGGELLVPRLRAVDRSLRAGRTRLDSRGTVLITGGTGYVGALLARHLVRAHGVRHMVLASRRGPAAPGAARLQAELAELGCDARVVACDVTDRAALERLLAGIAPASPLTAVIHAAGTLDDALIESMDRRRLDRVMAPKMDAAIALDELTAGLELSAFVLISSAASFGNAGQANYAAANAVLNAIAQRRRSQGVAGQSLAFGLWQRGAHRGAGVRGDALAELESEIRAGTGMIALEADRGLALFDMSLAAGGALLAPMRLDMDALRANARVDAISPVLHGLVSRPTRRGRSTTTIRRRLGAAGHMERDATLRGLVREELSAVLGDGVEIDGDRTLIQLGGESLDALELRKRLEARTGVRLTARELLGVPVGAVADRLRAALEEADEQNENTLAQRRSSQEGSTALRALLENACESRRADELVAALLDLARLRPTSASVAARPPALPLTSGRREPRLICIPSFMAGSGPHQFARLARSFEGVRSVSALHLPGWRDGGPAPATLRSAIEALCAAVREAAGGQAYVLVGYSSGGAFAHALAERLESEQDGPVGVIMIDTLASGDGTVIAAILEEIVSRSDEGAEIDDADLLAMATYVRLSAEWQAGTVNAPALYVRATVPLAAVLDAEHLWAPFLSAPDQVSLRADHFTIIGEHAHATSAAIESWLGRLAAPVNGERRRGLPVRARARNAV